MRSHDHHRRPSRREWLGSTISVERLEGRTMMAADASLGHLVPPSTTTVAAHVFTPPKGPGDGGGTTTTVTTPGVPTGLTATAGDGRVALTWTAPTSTGGAARIGYVVQLSTDGGATWTTVTRRFDEPRAMIGDLKNGQAYVFHVAAVNRAGTSVFSDPSASVTPVGPVITLPSAPTGVQATARDGKAFVTWTAPADTGGAKRLGYMIQFSSDGGTTWNTVAPRFDVPRAVVPLLTNGTPYVFRVAAFNRAGQGAFSAPSAAVTPVATTLPGAPTGVTAVAGDGRVTVSWTAPTNTGGAERVGYVVQMSSDGGTTWTTITRRFDETRAVIPFLANGTAYTFRVAAVNKAGQGAFSDPSSPVTPVVTTPSRPRR
jgi:Neuraminidase (sialidase)